MLRCSGLQAREERSQRLADLAAATGSGAYLCGWGGLRYLDTEPFAAQGVMVVPSLTPAAPHGIWQSAGEASALWALASVGPDALAEELRGTADQVKEEAQASG